MESIHHLSLLLLHLLFLTTPLQTSHALISSKLGINYGQLGNNLPTPLQTLPLLRSIHAAHVKLYDATPSILSALSATLIQVSIMVPNDLIPSVATNLTASHVWVETYLRPFYPNTRIRYLLVGNEILSDFSLRNSTWPFLVPAMKNIVKSLHVYNIRNVKVGTTFAMTTLSESFPPSSGRFRSDIDGNIVLPMLRFLEKTRSFFFVDAYPYFVWSKNPNAVRLDFALLKPGTKPYSDPVTGLVYNNLLEQMLDAVAFAMARLGSERVPIAIAETGWPNGGDYDEIGANPHNAGVYNRNLARWVAAGSRTPARPEPSKAPAYLFALFNENTKGGPGTERHWGVFHPNGTSVYGVDLSGRTPEERLPELPPARRDYEGRVWCVAEEGAEVGRLEKAVEYACGQGNGTCEGIRKGGVCGMGGLVARASFVFNAYWRRSRGSGGTCWFDGVAKQTITDPSYGSCRFPSVVV